MDIFGLPIRVDRFTGKESFYVLSHFHRDHMSGLRKGWSKAPVLCSSVSANLLESIEEVPRENLVTIDPDETREFEIGGETLRVTALDANHCPGALMFIFMLGDRKIIYTGDFRINDHLRERSHLFANAEALYVDSTYASPEYAFPSQQESVELVIDAVKNNMEKEILVAIYTIGKTRIVEALYEEFGRPIFVSKDKLDAYEAMGCGAFVTANREEAGFIGYSRGYFDRYFRWDAGRNPSNSLVIYPSGMCNNVRRREGFFYVPYSEHCDWSEFREFVDMVAAPLVIQT